MPITGPKVQVPSALTRLASQGGLTATEWQAFFDSVAKVVYNGTRSGPTASRPTNALLNRWIGMPYFDTDLGYMIHLKSINPDVWVDSNGVLV